MNPFRRVARAQASRRLPDEQLAVAWQAVSLLLDYPTPEWAQSHDAIRRAVAGLPEGVRMPLGSFLDHVASQPLEDVQRAYVETFDHTRKCCLYLTYFTFGDTRRRGVALVQFKQAYRKAGLDLTEQELPDHLGVVLEFGATADVDGAWKLLNDHRAGIEMLRLALADRHSPWEQVLVALAATLPELDGEGVDAVRRLVEEGPPQEEVGLEGYALDPRLNAPPQGPTLHPPTTRLGESAIFPTIRVGADS
ncbi:MAG TPA: nitrate reductase molybdenum cofactor assembly chaperone [Intrasporangium sp.]|uniref:nitrate reductase molybdenum cofactor assembly chaperone n=1 Tax=Intrasporangium sp. TaxID=1925024 RepID=UPI002B48DFA8|nr:nitrate reductase molybdenum cofactor assembly chaperone [Intrasporangium sp.]HKX67415.1 nitrate reductase molybdenum cofactor assembly chaperone [Intrasporangium sp.]